MEVTKGEKTVRDYMLDGGLNGRLFSYGWDSPSGPSFYEVNGIGCEPSNGSIATLEVIGKNGIDKGRRKGLNLSNHTNDLEVFTSE